MFKLGGSTDLGASQSDIDTTEDESMNSTKNGLSIANSAGASSTNTVNSGSTNTGKTTTQNSGSTNTVTTGPTSSTVTNTGRVDTSQVMLSNDALNHLVNSALESNQGLAAVTSGQKAAGGYNSTTNTQLTNDLVSRIAGEVAVRGAKTVNTVGASTQTTNNSAQTTTQNIGASTSVADVLNTIGASTSSTGNNMNSSTVNSATEGINATKNGYTQQDVRNSNEDLKTSGEFGWIICTELAAQKKLNLKFYLSGLAVFNSYKDEYKKGYYIWGVPVVKYIRKHPDSWITKAWVSISNARIEYLAALGGNRRARKTFYGFMMTHTLYWACVLFSKTIARNYTLTSAD